MTIFTSTEAVDMTTLPEIALLAGGDLQIEYAQQNLAIGHIGDVSYLLSGILEDGFITGVAVIKGEEIAYQFREMLIIPDDEGDELDTLDEVLSVILAGNDRIIGSGGSDTLIGLRGGDRREGQRGDDTLIGGDGADRLSGGGGTDKFVFNALPSSGRRADAIIDFKPGKDLIALDHLVFAEIGNRVSPSEFRTGAEANHKSDRIIYNDETGALFFDRDGKGQTNQVKIAMLEPDLDVKAADFFIL